jgi:hypothetical protein
LNRTSSSPCTPCALDLRVEMFSAALPLSSGHDLHRDRLGNQAQGGRAPRLAARAPIGGWWATRVACDSNVSRRGREGSAGPRQHAGRLGRSASVPVEQSHNAEAIATEPGGPIANSGYGRGRRPSLCSESRQRCYFCKSVLWNVLVADVARTWIACRRRWHQRGRSW